MGLQLSVLFGCVGAIELLACLKHVVVCKMQLVDVASHCRVDYFHRPSIVATDDDFVIVDKTNLEEESQACSEIEAILRQNKAEPNVLCIAPPSVEGYVRVPTPIPFGMDDEVPMDRKSSSNSSLVDSGNENPTRQTPVKVRGGSSSDVSSLEDTENHEIVKTKKVLRRSRTPEGCLDDKKAAKTRRSAENLSAAPRRSKRQREPERCKSDIQPMSRNALRDEWTNTSPIGSNVDVAASKRNISVLIQTSFEDKLRETSSCRNCRCDEERVRKVTERDNDGKAQLVKISSFEEASDNDYSKLKDAMTSKKKTRGWTEKVTKSSVESESLDEYVDAEEEGMTFCEQPIQFSIPDHVDNQAFWVIDK